MTARPMRPKSALGEGRADAPTLMPAKRALESVGKFSHNQKGRKKKEKEKKKKKKEVRKKKKEKKTGGMRGVRQWGCGWMSYPSA